MQTLKDVGNVLWKVEQISIRIHIRNTFCWLWKCHQIQYLYPLHKLFSKDKKTKIIYSCNFSRLVKNDKIAIISTGPLLKSLLLFPVRSAVLTVVYCNTFLALSLITLLNVEKLRVRDEEVWKQNNVIQDPYLKLIFFVRKSNSPQACHKSNHPGRFSPFNSRDFSTSSLFDNLKCYRQLHPSHIFFHHRNKTGGEL